MSLLTEQEIEDLYFDGFSMSELYGFARAIETKVIEKITAQGQSPGFIVIGRNRM